MDRTTPAIPSLFLSAKAARTHEQPISYLIAYALANPDLINLAAGLVDDETLPADECLTITQKLFSDKPRARRALQYDTTLGLRPLRHALLKHIEALESKPASAMNLSADDILITTGSQQALYLIGDALLNPGDIVIAPNPSYFVYTGTLTSLGATILPTHTDENGLDPDALDQLLSDLAQRNQLPRVKLIYLTSYYDNPTGLTLSADRRPRLLEIAKKYSQHHRILILEDAAYRELRYDGPALPSIKSYDQTNQYTILTQTFSKPFAPGLKTGYTALPPDLMNAVLQQKGNHDFGSANLCQQILLEALESGAYAHHVQLLQHSYRAKRDTMLEALNSAFCTLHSALTWTRPHGGLYIWLTLPDNTDTSRPSPLFHSALTHGVLYVPGDYCFQPHPTTGHLPKNHLRLSFGQVPKQKIPPGIHRLAEAIREHLR